MKQAIAIAAAAIIAVTTHAASVGWSAMNIGTSYNGDAYKIFVIGQKGIPTTDSIKFITDKLDAGESVDSYAFGGGTVASGRVMVSATAAGQPTLGEGTYTSFMVLFDAATPKSGESQYLVLSGVSTQTQTVGANSASVTFVAGNVGSAVSTANNWKSFGPVPEPTTVALLALGLAAVGLKRKVA